MIEENVRSLGTNWRS